MNPSCKQMAAALALAAVAVLLWWPSQSPALSACHTHRRKECDEDELCLWRVGAGCKDADDGRYFQSRSTPAEPRKRAFCRCVLHLMAKGVSRPFAICARTTGTSTGGKPCHYDFSKIPHDEIVAYARHLEQRSLLPRGTANSSNVRQRVSDWYSLRSV